MRQLGLALLCILGTGVSGFAANLDITASYKEKGVSYSNIDFNAPAGANQSFLYSDARLGVSVSKIYLETTKGEDSTMDVGLLLRALGVAGSTTTLANGPTGRVAANYPATNLTPFIENAYVRVHQFLGKPVDATFGRQTYKLGSGLILDDDGAGLMGVTAKEDLPFWNMKAEQFVFQDRNVVAASNGGPNELGLFGFSFILPTEGTWQLSELLERDRTTQQDLGCTYTAGGTLNQCMISKAMRSFTDVDYKVSYGPMVFDGEAAIERGAATPTNGTQITGAPGSPAPALGNHITYDGNAEVIRAKWKQPFFHSPEGIARLSFARGSGNSGNPTRDSAFFPSHGHQFEGLERSGFGDYFGASPYSTFASTSAANASGVIVVGAGYTPPSYKGFVLDIDYFLLQADRVASGSRTLGGEWDLRLRYNILSHFTFAMGADFVSIGKASSAGKGSARKYYFEAQGRF